MRSRFRFEPIPRAAGVTNRLVVLAFGGRFTDELLSGLPTVLTPTFRELFGLSYTQLSLLFLTLHYVATAVELVSSLLIDLWRRRWLMAWGAAVLGLAIVVMGLAPTYLVLLIGFAIYGLGSGPLAHTADVVLVDAHPQAPDRIFARANLFDTFGALLAPLSVAATAWLGLDWRWLLALLGASSILYGWLIFRTPFPPHAGAEGHESVMAALRGNVRSVIGNRKAIRWLVFLFCLALLEQPEQFVPIWLHEQVGMSQALIGLYTALELAAGVVSLLFLDRWLRRSGYRRVLLVATLGTLVLYPLWLFASGILARFVLGFAISFLFTVFWPIGRGQSLASVPGKGGTITALDSLLNSLPLALLFGWLAEWTTLTAAMFWVQMAAGLIMLVMVWRLPDEEMVTGASTVAEGVI